VARYLRTVCWLLFWFGLAFYLQLSAVAYATHLSALCLGCAVVVMLNLLRKG
jgi:hypothetical protein